MSHIKLKILLSLTIIFYGNLAFSVDSFIISKENFEKIRTDLNQKNMPPQHVQEFFHQSYIKKSKLLAEIFQANIIDLSSFEQILLLSLIEYAKHNNKYLELTEKEQKIFGSLFPEVKKVLNKYVIQHEKEFNIRTFFKVMGDVFLSRECWLRYKNQS